MFRKHGYVTAQIGKWHTGVDGGFGRDWDYQIIWNRPKYVKNSPNYYYDQLTEFNGGKAQTGEGLHHGQLHRNGQSSSSTARAARTSSSRGTCGCATARCTGPSLRLTATRAITKTAKPQVSRRMFTRRDRASPSTFERWNTGSRRRACRSKSKVRELGPVGMKDIPGRPLRDWIQAIPRGRARHRRGRRPRAAGAQGQRPGRGHVDRLHLGSRLRVGPAWVSSQRSARTTPRWARR